MKNVLIIVLSLFVFGCATSNQKNDIASAISSGEIKIESNDGKVVKLAPTSKICVFVPKDGYNPDNAWKPVQNSGLQLANAVTEAFSEYFPKTNEIVNDKDLNAAIKKARSKQYDYIIYPKIIAWTDHNTLLTGIPNQAKINLRIYNLKQKKIDNSIVISEQGSQFESYGVTTVNLIEKPLQEVAEQLALD